MIVTHVVFKLVIVYILLSFLEYAGHRWFLHKMSLARRFDSRLLREICFNHMAKHHKRSYRHSDRERDDEPVQIVVLGLILGLFCCLILYPLDPQTTKLFVVCSMLHATVAWFVHLEMHRRTGKFYSKWRVFLYLEQKHILHHRHPGSNYNVILPLWDWILSGQCLRLVALWR